MTILGILQILLFFLLILIAAKPMGAYMAKVFDGEKTLLSPVFRPVERLIYTVCGVDEA